MKKCLYIENPLLLPNYYTLGMGLHDTGCPRQGQGRADKDCIDFRCQRRFKDVKDASKWNKISFVFEESLLKNDFLRKLKDSFWLKQLTNLGSYDAKRTAFNWTRSFLKSLYKNIALYHILGHQNISHFIAKKHFWLIHSILHVWIPSHYHEMPRYIFRCKLQDFSCFLLKISIFIRKLQFNNCVSNHWNDSKNKSYSTVVDTNLFWFLDNNTVFQSIFKYLYFRSITRKQSTTIARNQSLMRGLHHCRSRHCG